MLQIFKVNHDHSGTELVAIDIGEPETIGKKLLSQESAAEFLRKLYPASDIVSLFPVDRLSCFEPQDESGNSRAHLYGKFADEELAFKPVFPFRMERING